MRSRGPPPGYIPGMKLCMNRVFRVRQLGARFVDLLGEPR